MRILIAGAGGDVGRALTPKLAEAGHEVFGMTRSPEKAKAIGQLGAEPILADALNFEAVLRAVRAAKPEVIVHQLTALPRKMDPRKFDRELRATNLLRTAGTDNLIRAARVEGVRRVVAQSFAPLIYSRQGPKIKTEGDPIESNPAKPMRNALDAIKHLESAVLNDPNVEGIVLRYGFFYGPLQSTGGLGATVPDVRARRMPVVGSGSGVWSFVHIEDVASATQAAIERGRPGVYNIADDEPAPVSVWLPELARILHAKPPFRVPEWIARMAVGEAGIVLMTQVRGISNQKAKRELNWQLKWPSWRQGFASAFLTDQG
jgi:2-alkyl-3-oxoalkanoate reductase